MATKQPDEDIHNPFEKDQESIPEIEKEVDPWAPPRRGKNNEADFQDDDDVGTGNV